MTWLNYDKQTRLEVFDEDSMIIIKVSSLKHRVWVLISTASPM